MKAPKLVSGQFPTEAVHPGESGGGVTRISERRLCTTSQEILELFKYDTENLLMEGPWVRRLHQRFGGLGTGQ